MEQKSYVQMRETCCCSASTWVPEPVFNLTPQMPGGVLCCRLCRRKGCNQADLDCGKKSLTYSGEPGAPITLHPGSKLWSSLLGTRPYRGQCLLATPQGLVDRLGEGLVGDTVSSQDGLPYHDQHISCRPFPSGIGGQVRAGMLGWHWRGERARIARTACLPVATDRLGQSAR